MYCPSCGRPRASLDAPCPECGAQPLRRGGSSGWAWFFAGSTLSMALLLGGLLWALVSSGGSADVLRRLGGRWPTVPSASVAPVAPTLPPAAAAPSQAPTLPPAAAAPSEAPPAPTGGDETTRTARVGDIVASGVWKVRVDGSRIDQSPARQRVVVDLTVKNDGDRAATLDLPSTAPRAPPVRPASLDAPPPGWQEVQLTAPPPLELTLNDRAAQTFGGAFLSADGKPSGSYSYEAAPGDAVRLSWAFDVPASSAEPFTLDLRFGSRAGGTRARVPLDQKTEPPASLDPSDVGKVVGKDERAAVADLWALTVTGLDVGQPASSGERTVTVRLKAENLTGEVAVVAGPRGDTAGAERDFYAVDAAGHLAYSSSDTMPTTRVPAKSSRTVEVKLKAGREFATTGPYRFSVVIEPGRNRYAVFRVG